MKNSIQTLVRGVFRILLPILRVISRIMLERDSRHDCYITEKIFTTTRRILLNTPDWRCGSARVMEVAKEAFNALSPFESIVGKNYMDLGCGTCHPYGTSTIMFLNGAARCLALDVTNTDEIRAAEALYDLLADCATKPDAWHWSEIRRDDFLSNIYKFDISALKFGNLSSVSANVPLEHCVTDILDHLIADDSVDLMSSRAVLEHVMDFPAAVAELYRIMAPGAIAYHHIDLTDHRHTSALSRYHYWSFLAEDDEWSDGLCNRLRFSEIRTHFEKVGFEILKFEGRQAKMPKGFRSKLRGRFAQMSDDELEIIGIACVLRKPVKK